MPLVTLTVRRPKAAALKCTILDAAPAALVAVGVPAAGPDPEHVIVCVKETARENWAFAGGRILHA